MRPPRQRLLLLSAVVLAASVYASSATPAQRASAAKAPVPATAKEWAQLVARAKRAGEVTIYSTQIPARLAAMAEEFKRKYGISVTVNRQVDNVLVTQINAERSTGRQQADLWVSNSRPYVLGALKNGWVVDAVGPHFFNKGFDRTTFAKPGKAWVVGTAVLGYGWNTRLYSRGMNSFTDLLRPELRGRVGVLEPASPAAIDWWLWARETFGREFIPKLAAQQPRVYGSTVPMQQALTSGEITAGSFINTNIKDLIAQGAPVRFKLPDKAWNTPYYAMILNEAPHSAAAQLLADYLVSPEGQAVISKDTGSVLRNIRDTVYVQPRVVKLSELTPQKIAEFQAYWKSLFR